MDTAASSKTAGLPRARVASWRAPGLAPRLAIFAAPLLGCLAFAAFAPALRAGFINFDDHELFVDNPLFRGFGGEQVAWMFTTTHMGHYAPLTWLSHALDFSLFGLDPQAFHRTNLVLHALNAALFFLLARRLLAAARPRDASAHPVALHLAAVFSALFFAVHPFRTETVAWITERRGLLGSFFFLLALLAYLRACPPGSSSIASRSRYAASIALLLLSLLAKGLGMTFAAVLIVLDIYPLRRLSPRPKEWSKSPSREVWLQKIPYLLLGAASAAASAWAAQSNVSAVVSLAEWGPLARVGQALFGLAFYVRKTLVPRDFAILVELPYRFDFLEPRFVASAAAVLVAATAIVLLRRRAPALAAASAVYALALAPVLGLLQAGPQLVADRYSYLACMPWALLAGGVLLAAWVRWPTPGPRSFAAAVAGSIVACLLALAREQSSVWQDSRTLWSHAIEAGEDSSVAEVNLGGLDIEAERFDSALAHNLAATVIRPDQKKAWFNLEILYARAGRTGEAEKAGREACRFLKPAYMPLVNLGNLYMNQMNRLDDAIECYREAVADARSHGAEVYSPVPDLLLGVALRRRGDAIEARDHLEIAARHPQTRDEALRELAR